MSPVQLHRVSITMNLIKIISIWGASLMLAAKMGIIYADLKVKMGTYDAYGIRIDSLEKWKEKVTAYYIPKNK